MKPRDLVVADLGHYDVVGNKRRFSNRDSSTLLPIYSLCKSDRATWFSNLSDMSKTLGDMIQVPGDITLGEMTSGRLH